MPPSFRRHIGQLVVAGFSGTSLPVELRELAREFDLGGVVLFSRNIEAPLQVAEVAYAAQQLGVETPLWVSVDQEGGRVQRLRAPYTEWPPLSTLGRSADLELTKRFARALARELRVVGVTLDYAPVLDVNTNLDNPVIGDRAISTNSEEVAMHGAAIVRALQEEGVAACGKHFPGHGDTDLDSHHDLPVVRHEAARIREVELLPFRAAIDAKVATLMTAHVLYPAFDDEVPATLSASVVTGLLRNELQFDGLIVTDDMRMGAIGKYRDTAEASVQAVAAGCDMVLLCGDDVGRQMEVIEALIHAVEDGKLSERRVEDALAHQRCTKERFLSGAKTWHPPDERVLRNEIGGLEHHRIAEEMRRRL